MAFTMVAAGGERPVLKSVFDPAQGRTYVLLRDGVEVLGRAEQPERERVELPGWIWAAAPYSCPPDITLAPNGDALVTSNVMPIVWRIDRETRVARAHRLALVQDQGRDIGFTRLRWSGPLDAYIGTTDLGEVWRIDRELKRASKLSGIPPSAQRFDCDGWRRRPGKNGVPAFAGTTSSSR